MGQTGLLNSFLAAIQASLSVLLVIFYGGLAAHLKLLDGPSSTAISKICVKMFLPALLLTKIGAELHAGSAELYVVVLVWALACHIVSFLIGAAAHYLLGMPDWITAAIMFNNTTSYPLLLVQSLDETGILSDLVVTGESTPDAIERAKSYFLVFATISSCLTFAIGPRLIDSEHAPEPSDDKSVSEAEDDTTNAEEVDSQAIENERTHLLANEDGHLSVSRRGSAFFPSKHRHIQTEPITHNRRPSVVAKRRWDTLSDRSKWWLLFLYDFLNAPLMGAVLGTIIGLVSPLKRAFFNNTFDGGILSAWLTPSLKSIGDLFVPLPVVVAGVSLYLSMQQSRKEAAKDGTPWPTTIFILVVRFVLWPLISIGIVYLLAKNTTILGQDPMLWFTMMLMPTGPSAIKLITMVQVGEGSDKEQQKIAQLLTISYVISPVLAFTVVGALRASHAAI
ncbi:auxin efflux carrier [Calycina marina]|uniref:Auxin efflux carrier n=1 Tax=Calycina marina TaxID=1763456 RepID=A0A9P8CB34_9HELO|nr:auxin efflux carrier [Calycina marina]